MPIHDWTRVDAGLFHAFHHNWITALSNAINAGVLPPEYFALPEQHIQGPIPDVLTLKLAPDPTEPVNGSGGVSVAVVPPNVQIVARTEASIYAAKADYIAVRHRHGDVVAVIEIVSPGNKASKAEFRSFVEKAVELLQNGIHLLIVDLFPPGKRVPQGIHKAIWEEFEDDDFLLPADKLLTLVSYMSNGEKVAYVQPVAVGDVLPDMPLFVRPGVYIPAPLEASYQSNWADFPAAMKRLLEPRTE